MIMNFGKKRQCNVSRLDFKNKCILEILLRCVTQENIFVLLDIAMM